MRSVKFYKSDRLLFKRDFSDLIPILRQFFFICQERMVNLNSCNIMYLSKSKHDGLASVLLNIFPQRIIFAHNIYLSHCCRGIRLPLMGLLYHNRCCISNFSLLSTGFPADVKICKEMDFAANCAQLFNYIVEPLFPEDL